MPTPLSGVRPAGRPLYKLAYNDFEFDPAFTYTNSISCKPVPDASGRTIKYVETTLSVHTTVMADPALGTTDAQFNALKQRLTSQAGALYYQDKGFGDFNVNVPGGRIRDVAWGPIPQLLNAVPTGDAYVWDFDWSVTTRYPECDAAVFEGKIMEWVYRVEYQFDAGYETRRITGHIEVPSTRPAQGNRFLKATADDYRDDIFPECPRFFRPGPWSFTLSDDRRRLDFSYQFDQMPGPPPPPGIWSVKFASDVSNNEPRKFVQWTYTFNGEYTMLPGVPQAVAEQHFVVCCLNRIGEIKGALKMAAARDAVNRMNDGAGAAAGGALPGASGVVTGPGTAGIQFGPRPPTPNLPPGVGTAPGGIITGPGTAGVQVGPAVVDVVRPGEVAANASEGVTAYPLTWRARNPDYYDRPRAEFTMSWQVVGGQLDQIMAYGLYTRIPQNPENWDRWANKLSVYRARGIPGDRFKPDDDVIIDLCRPAAELPDNPHKLKPPAAMAAVAVLGSVRVPVNVTAASSWIEWHNDLEYIQDDAVLVHKTLPHDRTLQSGLGGRPRTLRTPGALSASGALSSFVPPEDVRPGFKALGAGTSPEFISMIVRPQASTYEVVMRGWAVRLGWYPTAPDLISIAGVPAVAANSPRKGDHLRFTTVGNVGLPMILASWQFRYLLPCAPGPQSQDPRGSAGPQFKAPPPPSGRLGRAAGGGSLSGGTGGGGAVGGALLNGLRRF